VVFLADTISTLSTDNSLKALKGWHPKFGYLLRIVIPFDLECLNLAAVISREGV